MEKKQALFLAFDEETAPYFCFAKDGTLFWQNTAAGQYKDDNFFELFPWADSPELFSRRTLSVTDPLRQQLLQVTAFTEDDELFYLASLEQLQSTVSDDRIGLIRQFNATVRHHLNDLFVFLGSLSESLEENDAISLQLGGIRKSALSMLKTVYNWDAELQLSEQELPRSDDEEVFSLLRDLLHSAAMLTVGEPLAIESHISDDLVYADFDAELLQIAILNFISIALANTSRKGEGKFLLTADFKDGWIRLSVSDDISSEIAKGHFSFGDHVAPFSEGESYRQQALSLMQRFVSFNKGQILLTAKDGGYRMVLTLPGRSDHKLKSESEYSYHRTERQSRFSLAEVMLSDRGRELF